MEYRGSLKVQSFIGESYVPVDKCKVTITPSVEQYIGSNPRD